MKQIISKDIYYFLKKAIDENLGAFSINTIGHYLNKTQLNIRTFKKDSRQIEFQISGDYNKANLALFSSLGKINIYFPALSLIFSTTIIKLDEGALVVGIPEAIFIRERRKGGRIDIKGEIEIIIKSADINIKINDFQLSKFGFHTAINVINVYKLKRSPIISSILIKNGEFEIEVKGKIGRASRILGTNNCDIYIDILYRTEYQLSIVKALIDFKENVEKKLNIQ